MRRTHQAKARNPQRGKTVQDIPNVLLQMCSKAKAGYQTSKQTLGSSSGPAQIQPHALQRDHCTAGVFSLYALKRGRALGQTRCSFGDTARRGSIMRKLGHSSVPLDRSLIRAVAGSLSLRSSGPTCLRPAVCAIALHVDLLSSAIELHKSRFEDV